MFPNLMLAAVAATEEVAEDGQMISVNVLYGIIAVLVCISMFYIVKAVCLDKAALDAEQEKLAEAAGGAQWLAGLPHLADLLRKAASGNIKRTFKAARALYDKYFKTARGPLMMVYDVFTAGWPHLRTDDEYANKVIEQVVETGLNLKMTDGFDIQLGQKAGLLREIWPKTSHLGMIMATRKWRELGPALRGLFDELMQDGGEVKIAMRVAKASFNMLLTSKVDGAKETADKIVTDRARELGWTPPVSTGT